MFPPELLARAQDLLAICRVAKLRVATAESCTGGLITACLTEIPGSSDVIERGFVTYANDAKTDMLGVPEDMLRHFGAVSEPVARAMAEGVLAHSPVELALSVTGIAGPGGESDDKPLGLVHLACARRRADGEIHTLHARHVFPGDRSEIRLNSVSAALALLMQAAR